jgi:hypothetical protein
LIERKRPVDHRFHPVLRDRVAHRLKIFDGPDGHALQALLLHHHERKARVGGRRAGEDAD